MKQLLLLCLIMASANFHGNAPMPQNPFAIYEGKYQMSGHDKNVYINIATKNKQLLLTESWSGVANKLKHLSGDNFIVELRGWAAKFNRDKKGKVISVLVMGHDLWTKVK
jgi:hypothetical protein